jgi:CrcB protein
VGTLAVNVAGTLALGVLVGAGLEGEALRLAATGLIASFTTFSTWALESHRLGRRAGAANLGAALVLGLGAVWLGRELGALL